MRSLLFLNREYIPFLPLVCDSPCGPTDPPLLPIAAPFGWWDERAKELFNAARAISHTIDELQTVGSSLHTPFSGFCLFSAAAANLYAQSFSWMVPDPCLHISRIVRRDLDALNKFRNVWRIGKGWWVTLQDCKSLYGRINERSGVPGKHSRLDHDALHSAIHDTRGQAPQDQSIDRGDNEPTTLSLEERQSEIRVGDEVIFDLDLSLELNWDQMWPIPASHNTADHPA